MKSFHESRDVQPSQPMVGISFTTISDIVKRIKKKLRKKKK